MRTKHIIYAITLISIVSITLACTAADQKQSVIITPQERAKMTIDEAQTQLKKAASVQGEWRDTGKILRKAQSALAENKFEDAIKLAMQAKIQAELGYEQAVSQQDLKLPSYLNN